MDLNRLRKNIINRDWGSKTKKTNINYLKSKLKDFGVEIPKYLKDNNLSSKNIAALTNKIIRAIDNQREINRINYTPQLPSKEKALASLNKAIEKHNKTVLNKIDYIQKAFDLNEKQLNYLMGYKTTFDYGGYSNTFQYTFERENSPFSLINNDINFNKVETIIEYTKFIKEQTKRLNKSNILKELKTGVAIKKKINEKLTEWTNDAVMDKAIKKELQNKINQLSPIQREILLKMMNSTGMDSVKYVLKGSDDDEELKYNLVNKMNILIGKARDF